MDNWEIYYRTHKGKGSNAITGVPPLTFVSNGQNLVDYRIDGASGGVGGRTKNLAPNTEEWVNGYISNNGTISPPDRIKQEKSSLYIPVTHGETLVFMHSSGVFPRGGDTSFDSSPWRGVGFYNSAKQFIMRSADLGRDPIQITVPNEAEFARISYRTFGDTLPVFFGEGMFYEPYGYKIPVVCGGTTTNIYLDEPLEENETISMSDTGVSIPTINGSNTLSIGTTVQPSNIYIKYGGGSNVNQSLMKYLEYKYKFAKG